MAIAKPGFEFSPGGGKRIDTGDFIGFPYGAVFIVDQDGSLRRVPRSMHDEADTLTDSTAGDNRHITDSNDAQALTMEDIMRLKETVVPEDLPAVLASHSASFSSKTEYAQAKYLKKKRAKHVIEIKLVYPTAATIAALYFSKKPERVLWMRPDTLALLLESANLRPGGQVVVVDTTIRLVVAAIVERLGGYGRVLSGYHASSSSTNCSRILNMTLAMEASLVEFPLGIVDGVTQGSHGDTEIERWLAEPCDSLVLVPSYDAEHMFLHLFPFLANGGTFVVYSTSIEQLAALNHHLKSTKAAVDLRLTSNWFREHQVLPGRTHPNMSRDGRGGYLLSGIKVVPAFD